MWRKIAHDLLRFTLLARPRRKLRYRVQPRLSQTETIPDLIVSHWHVHICLFEEKRSRMKCFSRSSYEGKGSAIL